jgi:hypothetical protein
MDRSTTSNSSPELLAVPDVPAVGGGGTWLNAPTLPHVEAATHATLPSIPGFELLRELGRGGMGVVYQARNLANGQTVAVKVLIAGAHAGALERERFRREMSSAALQHPNIVKLLNAGEHHGLPYIVLEYVDGGTLADRLTGTPWSPTAAVKLVAHLAKAVQFAHARDIIHRDLKPANILFADDVPKLTDFGLSKTLGFTEGVRPVTETGAVLGTPSYISPEQATGDKEVGPASDVYSLGAILYELLTGRPPFDGKTTLDIVLKVLNDAPVAPTRFAPDLPTDLEAIVLKCLHKNPAKRYLSATDLLADLQRFLVGESVVARPPSVSRRLLTWFGRRPRLTTAAATTAVMLFLMLGVATYAVASIREATARAEAAALAAETARLEAERAKAEVEYVRAVADQEHRQALELRAKYDQLRQFLESFRPGKLAWVIESKKPTPPQPICVEACEAPEPPAPQRAEAIPARHLSENPSLVKLLAVVLMHLAR